MTHWSWWISGLALAGVMIFHWLTTQRMMAVSGRFTAIVNRLRKQNVEPAPEMSAEELLAAIQSATLAEFAPAGLEDEANAEPPFELLGETDSAVVAPELPGIALPTAAPSYHHVLFFAGITLGGALSLWLAGGANPTLGLRSLTFSRLTGDNPVLSAVVLTLGGVLVGFGTRMAGGCTSGHGLCGMSRLQTGSMVATASFFGAGIVVSFALQALL